MTDAPDKNDDQWLSALAGKPDLTSDKVTNTQADALHRALQAQSQRMDKFVPAADDPQYQQLLFRLRKEGLTGKPNSWSSVVEWGRAKGQLAARAMTAHNSLAWAIAATTVLVIGVALQMNSLHQGQDASRMHEVFRSGQGTVLIVTNPKSRANELQSGLNATGTETVIVSGPDGQLQLKFKPNSANLEYLSTQRIDPIEVDGFVILTLKKPQ